METQQLLEELRKVQQELIALRKEMKRVENSLVFMYDIKEIQAGAGDLAFRLDKNGAWWGKKSWADVSTGTPQGTGVGMDGTFYGKDGLTGTVTIGMGGGSFNVKNGLVI